MKRLTLSFVFFTICLSFSASGYPETEVNRNHSSEKQKYFNRHEEGWFWYEIIEEPEEAPEEQPLPPPAQIEITVDDIKRRGEELLNKALLEPTPENVREYIVHQKFVFDRSQQFAEVWRDVIWQNPQLDETVEHPTSTLGIQVAGIEEKKSIKEVIGKLSEVGKLIFFFTSACPYCKEQSRLLTAFKQNYPVGIMGISLDGQGIDGWTEYKIDRGQAANLGVDQVPALFLLVPPERVIRIGTGLMTYDEIERRLYIVGKEVLGIKEDSYPTNEAFLSPPTPAQISPTLNIEEILR